VLLSLDRTASAQQLDALRATSRIVRDELDTAILCGALARHATRLFRTERAALLVLEGTEVVARAASIDGGLITAFPVNLNRNEALANFVLRHHLAYLENSPTAQHAPCFARDLSTRNLLTVPIFNHQRGIIGLLELHNRRDRACFYEQDLEVAEVFALQAAIGIERARLYDRMNEWSQSLEMLLGFNAAVNQHLSPRDLVRRLIENAARFLKADGGQAGLVVPLPDNMDCMESEGYFHRGRWHERSQRWMRMDGLPGLVLESEFPYLTNDYSQDRLADPALLGEFHVARALCVPIKNIEQKVVGYFELHKQAEGTPFSWQDAAFLESLGNTTAVAIQNASLLKALESKNREIQALSIHNVQRLEEERRHIARELHDEAGQALIGIKLALQLVSRRIPDTLPQLREEIDQLRDQVNSATVQLKDLARRLRLSTLDPLGLDVALRQLIGEFERLSEIAFEVDVDRLDPAPNQDCAIAIYRIAQEAATNCLRYAQASQARLAMWRHGGILIFEFEDNGVGFAVDDVPAGGLGLLGMRERARMLGGKLEIRSKPGSGTQIVLEIPNA
jgi:signal transduction histidine kinase